MGRRLNDLTFLNKMGVELFSLDGYLVSIDRVLTCAYHLQQARKLYECLYFRGLVILVMANRRVLYWVWA
ncbi:hypothetical protein CRENPOLYSF1_850019 [Crenothrix polyspora]|uniref:Uncharacterized protein n=1 Tax=Crenothrix polyspora TaxID=360316 RepID=A0A1R4HIQ1_9GAMM|nr:hypothetical protein CRENPOLYSF1_850019 [Crenothrix polyspora]